MMKHCKPLTNPVIAQLEDRPTVLDILGNKDFQPTLILIIGVPILYQMLVEASANKGKGAEFDIF